MSKKSHHFLTLWPWPLTYDLEKLIRSGHYHYQCVYQIWEQSIPWFLSYRVNTIAGGGRLRRKTITSPDPSDTGDIITKSGRSFHWGLVHLVQSASLCWNSPKIFHTVFETLSVGAKSLPILPPDYWHPPQSNFTEYKQDVVAVFYTPVNGQWVH